MNCPDKMRRMVGLRADVYANAMVARRATVMKAIGMGHKSVI